MRCIGNLFFAIFQRLFTVIFFVEKRIKNSDKPLYFKKKAIII